MMGFHAGRSALLASVLASGVLGLSGCSSMAYYWQASVGHLGILGKARSVDAMLQERDGDERLLKQLEHARNIRGFSVQVLHLPDNSSYRRYAKLDSAFPVWNVLSAPVNSMELDPWCFPVLGCIAYKGFYEEAKARERAAELRASPPGAIPRDVAVMGVPAYSTLGFTPDPLLSSFIYYPAGELARLVFHELAHQVVYIADDTAFNESFATAVEELGVEAWLAQPAQAQEVEPYRQFDAKRRQFKAWIAQARDDLQALYAQQLPLELTLARKAERLQRLRETYERTKREEWGAWAGFDRYFNEDLNNAKLAVGAVYNEHVPAFRRLFRQAGGDFPAFYAEVKKLGDLSRPRRHMELKRLAILENQK